jgi:tRNA/tmRNA/rRNA uracil-C5-methylase (TrmA/RlmC/RlmD family)
MQFYTLNKIVERAMKCFDQSKLVSSCSTTEDSVIADKTKDKIDWCMLPLLVRPYEGGQLPIKRAEKKCQQLESLALAVVKLIKERPLSKNLRIVDFCSGGGHLAILLAYLMPHLEVYLVENKPESLERALNRVQQLQLKNCRFFQGKTI